MINGYSQSLSALEFQDENTSSTNLIIKVLTCDIPMPKSMFRQKPRACDIQRQKVYVLPGFSENEVPSHAISDARKVQVLSKIFVVLCLSSSP